MNTPGISVIIPTFQEPEYLDLCLHSLYLGRVSDNIEVIVVVDGHQDINQEVLHKYIDEPGFHTLIFPTNVGLQMATNVGVWKASREHILIVNDDNVFPEDWDKDLEAINISELEIVSPNQMEPNPSIFDQFIIKNLGETTETFNLNQFISEANIIRKKYRINTNKPHITPKGSTLPIFMTKRMFMSVGGWDNYYSSPHVCDMDFFLKLKLAGCKFGRANDITFYHFGGKATTDPVYKEKEERAHQQFKYKWGIDAARERDYSIKD